MGTQSNSGPSGFTSPAQEDPKFSQQLRIGPRLDSSNWNTALPPWALPKTCNIFVEPGTMSVRLHQ